MVMVIIFWKITDFYHRFDSLSVKEKFMFSKKKIKYRSPQEYQKNFDLQVP